MSRKRSVAEFFRMKLRWPSTREATSASSKELSGTRCGRDRMKATALPVSRPPKLSSPPSRRTSSSSRARRGACGVSATLPTLDVEPGRLQPPARDLGDELAGGAQPLDEDMHQRLEEGGG